MTTAEKIEAIEKSGFMLAWEGCHKLYFCEDEAQQKEATASGYTLYPAAEIRDLVSRSCGLVFVHPWDLEPHEWDIPQFAEGLRDAVAAARA